MVAWHPCRLRASGVAGLALVALWTLSGCSGADLPGPASSADPSAAAPSSSGPLQPDDPRTAVPEERARPYAASLVPIGSAAPTGDLRVMLSNIGESRDSYIVRAQPPDAALVLPETVSLGSGRQSALDVRIRPGATSSGPLRIVVFSRRLGLDVAELELPEPSPEE